MKYLNVEKQGQLLKVALMRPSLPALDVHSTRGIISQFSAKSRKRLIEQFTRLDHKKMKFTKERVKFIALTYIDNMQDGALAKLHLKRFIERLQYEHAELWCVWKMEFQERGAIHFHLIVGNMPFTEFSEIQKMWSECSEQAENVFTRIEAIKSIRGVLSYAAKYMTKEVSPNTGEEVKATDVSSVRRAAGGSGCLVLSICHNFGRFWGVYGRQHLPLADKVEVMCALTDSMYNWFLSIVDSPYCNTNQSWSVFGEHVDRLYKALGTLYTSDDSLAWMLEGFLVQKPRVENQDFERWLNNVDAELKIASARRDMLV
jgi:hypothetical protein